MGDTQFPMEYKDLYHASEQWIANRTANNEAVVAVPIAHLKTQVIDAIDWLNGVNFWPVNCHEGDPFGHFELFGDRESRWDDDNAWTARISYDQTLINDDERYVWAKEMMHIFDAQDGQVNSEILFKSLLYQIEIEPPTEDRTEVYWADNEARWKAVLILCPKTYRDQQKALFDAPNGNTTIYDVAAYFRIPETIARSTMSQGYDSAYSRYIDIQNE